MCQRPKFCQVDIGWILLLQKQNFNLYYIGFMVYVYVLGFRIPHLGAIAIVGTNGKYDIVRSYLCGVKQNLL